MTELEEARGALDALALDHARMRAERDAALARVAELERERDVVRADRDDERVCADDAWNQRDAALARAERAEADVQRLTDGASRTWRALLAYAEKGDE